MTDYDTLATREGRLRDLLAGGAEDRLRAIPGVVHVSAGLRERGYKPVAVELEEDERDRE